MARKILSWNGSGTPPRSLVTFYECTGCDDFVSSMPPSAEACDCGNVAVTESAVVVGDSGNVRVVEDQQLCSDQAWSRWMHTQLEVRRDREAVRRKVLLVVAIVLIIVGTIALLTAV